MRAFFSQYGKVVDCTVMVDRESGRSKGFGFVTFEDASNTDQLVGHANLLLDEKQVRTPSAPSTLPLAVTIADVWRGRSR